MFVCEYADIEIVFVIYLYYTNSGVFLVVKSIIHRAHAYVSGIVHSWFNIIN